jgi:serine/threonine protein kinase/formylglycine-generating enzyme required for sulfatase activity
MISSSETIEQIFSEALRLSSEDERGAYLERACGGDRELRQLVEKLLRAQPKAAAFLEQPFAQPGAELVPEAPAFGEPSTFDPPMLEGPGTEIGVYKLQEQIGEGGFGVVFMAEQKEPIHRKVALKVLKPGMDTKEVIARLEVERQALAIMDHPNIAKVLDAGTISGVRRQESGVSKQGDGESLLTSDPCLLTPDAGRPYFVMELVQGGMPITKFCDQGQLTIKERLELFVHVCRAVQHAHQKGVIHRDLKPSNVLVTMQDGAPVVKVIDFGVAKVLGPQLTDKTFSTAFAHMVGTPLYMSPEQAALSNVDVDTRSDIYSLGVLLYELLTGTTPFDKDRFQQTAYDEMRRIVREEEPPRPSTRISTLGEVALAASAQRKSNPKRLSQLFRGELDWIVMKALDKDRNRRFETANNFAEDIQRYLANEPVQAGPPTASYRLRKFLRRHRAGVLIAVVLLAILAAVAVGIGWVLRDWAAREARRLRDRLLEATTVDVPAIVKDMAPYRGWLNPFLYDAYARAEKDKDRRKQLHASLALLPVDSGQVEYLYGRLLDAEPQDVIVIRKALFDHSQDLTVRLWSLLENPTNDQDQRLHAACALATFAPDDSRWEKVRADVASTLVIQKPFVIAKWGDALKDVAKWLVPPLADMLADENRAVSERGFIASVYGSYAAELPEAYARLEDQLDEKSDADAPVEAKTSLARKQASIGVALLVMGRTENVWRLLQHQADPTLRSYLIDRLGPAGVDPKVLTARLDQETEVSARRAILLSLGEFGPDRLSQDQRLNLLPRLLELYRDDPDPGIYGATEWLLRKWGQGDKLPKVMEEKLRQGNKEVKEIRQRISLRQATLKRQLLQQAFPASLKDGLIAHYPLDETGGYKAADGVKGQPGATYRGSVKPQWVPGVMGGALRLDGNEEFAGSALDLDSNDPFSYGCWFLSEAQPAMILLSTRDYRRGFRGFDLSLEPGYKLRMEIVGEDPKLSDSKGAKRQDWSPFRISVATTTKFAPRDHPEWHHVLVTYDGSEKAKGVFIYVDGQPQPLAVNADDLQGTIKSDALFLLGSRGQGTHRWEGQIDDVRVYNRRLDSTDVRQLYESGIQTLARSRPEERTPELDKLLAAYFQQFDEPLQRLAVELAGAQKSYQQKAQQEARTEQQAQSKRLRRYVTGQGQTMIIVSNPDEFWMGEGPERHRRQIGRSFAIASKEVTTEQFLRFRGNHRVFKEFAPTMDCPVNYVTWYDAVAYCNWLSEQEGIAREEWCYVPNKAGKYGSGMKMAANYLQRTGYRLPTEAEWEYTCRAGADTGYSFGEPEDLVGKYAWHVGNSSSKSQPTGRLRPNELGVFDMHGNVWEWTQDIHKPFVKAEGGIATSDSGDMTDLTEINDMDGRGLRGGSFYPLASNVRSACRFAAALPAVRAVSYGFRPARTFR